MNTPDYYRAADIPAGARVRDPDRGNYSVLGSVPGPDEAPEIYGIVTHVEPRDDHTVRVHWENGDSCVHPNGARFVRG